MKKGNKMKIDFKIMVLKKKPTKKECKMKSIEMVNLFFFFLMFVTTVNYM